MFLLIPIVGEQIQGLIEFTFQYVSINTKYDYQKNVSKVYLHSNMFLLIHGRDKC